MNRSSDIRRNIDGLTIVLFLALAGLGWVNLVSAATGPDGAVEWGLRTLHGKQGLWLMVSLLIGFLILQVEGTFFIRTAWLNYGIQLLLCGLVLVIGKKVGGARSWFGFGGFGIQPSEFAKMGASLALAWYCSKEGGLHQFGQRFRAAVIVGLPAGLILLQPDAGTVLVFLGFVFAMYREGLSGAVLIVGFAAVVMAVLTILSGAGDLTYPFVGEANGIYRFWILFVVLGAGTIALLRNATLPRYRARITVQAVISAIAALLFSVVMHLALEEVLRPHQRERIQVLFGLEVDNPDADYNIRHAKTAIGSGGWTGMGWRNGPMTGYGFVPEQETDFIFCTWSEEWGLVGSTIFLILFASFILRILFLAERQRSAFTRVYAYSLGGILFMHMLINVGMVLGLAPVIGIPLPFMSYGGSSFMAFALMVAILVRLDAERFSVLR
ncbi:MAG TPA: rod shape-determining protein RodA [Flavobacteriales bacterium]|jgi:rod shape determining protein RodA|nr:rod shape-determining protein RodA [Flavobacteriales bacterium]